MALPSWLTVSPTSGERNGTLSLVASQHTGRAPRSFTITGTTGHKTKKELSITQAAAPELISVTAVLVDSEPINPDSEYGDRININFRAKDNRNIKIYFISNSASLKLVDNGGNLFYPDKSGASLPTIKLYSCDMSKIGEFPTGTEVKVSGGASWTNSKETLTLDGDPGAIALCGYYMEISNIPEVKSTTAGKQWNIVIANDNGTVTSESNIVFKQAAGVKSYSRPVVKTFSYPDVPAAGLSGSNSITPTITVEQTWGWNGDVTNGGTIINSDDPSVFTYTYLVSSGEYDGWTLEETTGKITNVASLGKVVSDRKRLDSIEVVVTANGMMSDAENVVDIFQAPNTRTSGVPEFVWDQHDAVTVETNTRVTVSFASQARTLRLFNASGLLHNVKQVLNYASGASETLMLDANSFDMGNPDQVCTLAVTNPVEGFALNKNSISTSSVVVTENYETTARNGFVITITINLNGQPVVATVTFNQQAGSSTLTFTPASVTFDANGGTKEVTITSNDSWTITF